MNLDWFSFEESYLLKVEYEISKCTLHLLIDAKKSISYPEVTKIKSYEDSFEAIEVCFKDILYYRGISSLNILNDPNEDIGSIDQLLIGTFNVEDGIGISKSDNLYKISMENNGEIITELLTHSSNLQFIEFISDMISFRAGFNACTITKAKSE